MVTKKKGARAKKSVKKKVAKKTMKKKSVTKRKPKTKAARAKKKTKIKETVRIKTFIVEKPVYVETPTRREQAARARHPESFEMFDPSESRYAKNDLENIPDSQAKDAEEFFDEGEGAGDFPEDGEGFDEPLDGEGVPQEGEEADYKGHPRSRAMFSKVWWKRAFWQAAAIWILIFIFAFFMDFVNLSEVELQRNWVYLFIVIFAVMLAYQKILKGKIVI